MALSTLRPEKNRAKKQPAFADGDWQEIEIFRAGTHTDSGGFTREWTTDDIDQIVEAYDPKNYKAPLIVSHEIDAYSVAWGDEDPAEMTDTEKHRAVLEASLAYGYPQELVRRSNSLFARFERIDPQFVEWVRNGNLMAISSSFYMEDHPANPTPGKIALRHIAALGTDPPAVKGMELNLSEALLAFSNPKPESGCLTFSFEVSASDGETKNEPLSHLDSESMNGTDRYEAVAGLVQHIAYLDGIQGIGPFTQSQGGLALVGDVLGRIRESIVASEGVEAAEALVPREVVSKLQGAAIHEVPETEDLFQRDQWLREEFRSEFESLYQMMRAVIERLESEPSAVKQTPIPVYEKETDMPGTATKDRDTKKHENHNSGDATPESVKAETLKDSNHESSPAAEPQKDSDESAAPEPSEHQAPAPAATPAPPTSTTPAPAPAPAATQTPPAQPPSHGQPPAQPPAYSGGYAPTVATADQLSATNAHVQAFQAQLERMEQSFTSKITALQEENQRLQADREVLTGQVLEHRQDAIMAHFTSLVRECQIPPALAAGFVARLDGVPNYTEGNPVSIPQFAASLSAPGRAWFEELLKAIGGMTKPLSKHVAPSYETPPQVAQEYDPKTIARKAKAYAEQHGVDYPAALDAVLSGQQD